MYIISKICQFIYGIVCHNSMLRALVYYSWKLHHDNTQLEQLMYLTSHGVLKLHKHVSERSVPLIVIMLHYHQALLMHIGCCFIRNRWYQMNHSTWKIRPSHTSMTISSALFVTCRKFYQQHSINNHNGANNIIQNLNKIKVLFRLQKRM